MKDLKCIITSPQWVSEIFQKISNTETKTPGIFTKKELKESISGAVVDGDDLMRILITLNLAAEHPCKRDLYIFPNLQVEKSKEKIREAWNLHSQKHGMISRVYEQINWIPPHIFHKLQVLLSDLFPESSCYFWKNGILAIYRSTVLKVEKYGKTVHGLDMDSMRSSIADVTVSYRLKLCVSGPDELALHMLVDAHLAIDDFFRNYPSIFVDAIFKVGYKGVETGNEEILFDVNSLDSVKLPIPKEKLQPELDSSKTRSK